MLSMKPNSSSQIILILLLLFLAIVESFNWLSIQQLSKKTSAHDSSLDRAQLDRLYEAISQKDSLLGEVERLLAQTLVNLETPKIRNQELDEGAAKDEPGLEKPELNLVDDFNNLKECVYGEFSVMPEIAKDYISNFSYGGRGPGRSAAAFHLSKVGYSTLNRVPALGIDEVGKRELAKLALQLHVDTKEIRSEFIEDCHEQESYLFVGTRKEAKEHVKSKKIRRTTKIVRLYEDLFGVIDLAPLLKARPDYALKLEMKANLISSLEGTVSMGTSFWPAEDKPK